MAHVRVWKFRPLEGREEEFAHAYSAAGPWGELFGTARGYRGTALMKPAEPGGWWLTLDRWETAADFEAFQRDLGDDYRALDAQLEGVAGEEDFVGQFEED